MNLSEICLRHLTILTCRVELTKLLNFGFTLQFKSPSQSAQLLVDCSLYLCYKDYETGPTWLFIARADPSNFNFISFDERLEFHSVLRLQIGWIFFGRPSCLRNWTVNCTSCVTLFGVGFETAGVRWRNTKISLMQQESLSDGYMKKTFESFHIKVE